MAAALPAIFTAVAGGVASAAVTQLFSGGSQPKPQAQGPSIEETAAQKKQEALTDAKTQRETSERATREKIITARAAGPQTLFTRPGSIPRPVKLGGGRA